LNAGNHTPGYLPSLPRGGRFAFLGMYFWGKLGYSDPSSASVSGTRVATDGRFRRSPTVRWKRKLSTKQNSKPPPNRTLEADVKSIIFAILILMGTACAQNDLLVASYLPEAPSTRKFWTTENKIEFSVLASLIAADAVTTQHGLNQGYREA